MPEPTPDTHEIHSSYDRWDQQPALGRRGMIGIVVVVVLIAAAGFGVVALVSRDSATQATAIRVPTSEWIPGQPGGDEAIRGTLTVDERRCVYLDSPQGRLWPVWPAGFEARLDGAGHVSLYGEGDLIARDGEAIQATGTFRSPAAYAGETCLPGEGDVAVVQSEVTRVG